MFPKLTEMFLPEFKDRKDSPFTYKCFRKPEKPEFSKISGRALYK